METRPMPNEVVQITWIDHHENDGHSSAGTLNEIINRVVAPCVYSTTGVLINEDEREYIVARDVRVDKDLDEPRYETYLCIQKPLVTSIVYFKKGRKP
jgi:hypothetical protein